jgi:hypothetical protein
MNRSLELPSRKNPGTCVLSHKGAKTLSIPCALRAQAPNGSRDGGSRDQFCKLSESPPLLLSWPNGSGDPELRSGWAGNAGFEDLPVADEDDLLFGTRNCGVEP